MRHASRGRDSYTLLLRKRRKRYGRPSNQELKPYSSPEELFLAFSKRLGYIEPDRAREIFFEFERLIIEELQKKKIIRLPGFGDFYLIHTPLKKVLGCARDKIKGQMERYVRKDIFEVRFKVHAKLRDYFRIVSDRIDRAND